MVMIDCLLPNGPPERQPVIVAARRTAIGRAFGQFSSLAPSDLLSVLIEAIASEVAIDVDEVDDVIVGNAAGGGGNVARLAALQAGLPLSVPGVTVDRQCGSGLEAVILAARSVASGAGDLFLEVSKASAAPPGVSSVPGGRARCRAFMDGPSSLPIRSGIRRWERRPRMLPRLLALPASGKINLRCAVIIWPSPPWTRETSRLRSFR